MTCEINWTGQFSTERSYGPEATMACTLGMSLSEDEQNTVLCYNYKTPEIVDLIMLNFNRLRLWPQIIYVARYVAKYVATNLDQSIKYLG